MKITAYEVRPDEKDYLLAAAQQEQIEITLVQGPMTQDNIDRAEGADGITILGDTKMDAALMRRLQSGVSASLRHVPSGMTILT